MTSGAAHSQAAGVRIKLDLSDLLSDEKRFSWVYLAYSSFSRVKDLIQYIGTDLLAGDRTVPKFQLLLEEPFCLPEEQSIFILKNGDLVKAKVRAQAMPGAKQDSRMESLSSSASLSSDTEPPVLKKAKQSRVKAVTAQSSPALINASMRSAVPSGTPPSTKINASAGPSPVTSQDSSSSSDESSLPAKTAKCSTANAVAFSAVSSSPQLPPPPPPPPKKSGLPATFVSVRQRVQGKVTKLASSSSSEDDQVSLEQHQVPHQVASDEATDTTRRKRKRKRKPKNKNKVAPSFSSMYEANSSLVSCEDYLLGKVHSIKQPASSQQTLSPATPASFTRTNRQEREKVNVWTNRSVVLQNMDDPLAQYGDLDSLPVMQAFPSALCVISFKILEMTCNYSPELCAYIGKIIKLDRELKEVTVRILADLSPKPEQNTGKFELEELPVPVSKVNSVLTYQWTLLVEPRQINEQQPPLNGGDV